MPTENKLRTDSRNNKWIAHSHHHISGLEVSLIVEKREYRPEMGFPVAQLSVDAAVGRL